MRVFGIVVEAPANAFAIPNNRFLGTVARFVLSPGDASATAQAAGVGIHRSILLGRELE